MCAIAGLVDLQASQNILLEMKSTMKRRGPDEEGIYHDNTCTLLHSRLTIIDPAGGMQPMTLNWDREEYILVYNGELYNTEELRNELLTAGHRFAGHSDTEVLLHAYAEWRENCLHKLNGIYAFAVWERNNKTLFLARDRIGVKPLFYTLYGNGIIFASEIKTVLCFPSVQPILDAEGAAQILLLGPGRKPGSGVFRNIYELEPGECARFESGKLHKKRYWKLTDREHTDSFEETAEKVRFLVMDAIKRQMVSDVPIGTFLSGGLDSSIISVVCAEEKKKAGETLQTFSVDYINNDLYFKSGKFQPNSDSTYIKIMADVIQSDHHPTVLPPQELYEALESSTTARDLPGMADVDFSLLAFCKEIRKNVKVALSGECADEIFGGYPWFRDPEVRAKEGFPWAQTTLQRLTILSPQIQSRFRSDDYVKDLYRQTCNESDILPGTNDTDRQIKEMTNLNFRWFMQTLLDRKDRMSMYHSLEVRVPFCDYRIAEYLYGIPWEMKDYQGREKGLLRYAFRDMLPEQIITRKKSPYPKTFDPLYEQLMQARLHQILMDSNSPVHALIDSNSLNAYLSGNQEWPWYGQLMRRPQTMAYFIQLDYWLRAYHIQIEI